MYNLPWPNMPKGCWCKNDVMESCFTATGDCCLVWKDSWVCCCGWWCDSCCVVSNLPVIPSSQPSEPKQLFGYEKNVKYTLKKNSYNYNQIVEIVYCWTKSDTSHKSKLYIFCHSDKKLITINIVPNTKLILKIGRKPVWMDHLVKCYLSCTIIN